MESTRGISRLKYKTSTDGWLARYTVEGETFRKTFSDSKYGSPEASKTAAEEWHKEVRSLFPPMTREEYFTVSGRTPESGITGVRRNVAINKGHEYPNWVATWRLRGKLHMKTFSVNKYGEEDAKRLAVEARQAVNDQLEAEWRDNYWNYRPHLINEKGYIEEPFAYEGEKKYVLHLQAERDRSIRGLKLDAFLQEHGKLFCEICSFSFEKAYGEVGKGLIEVHHLVPFSELSTGRNTSISDLMCVCSNCHLALHNGDPSENLRRLKIIFDSVTKKGANKTG